MVEFKNMKTTRLLPHVLTLILFIVEIFFAIQRIKEPVPISSIEEVIILYLMSAIIFFAIPLLYITKAIIYFSDLRHIALLLQIKLFNWFLYILLIIFVGLRILDLIF